MFSGSLVAIVTPMLEDGAIDLEAWDRLLDLHLQGGSAGVVVGGSTGESVTLTDAEQDSLLAHARRRLAGRMALIAGVGGSSTAAVVETDTAESPDNRPARPEGLPAAGAGDGDDRGRSVDG